jgi:anti-sigma regulatory factor (Ser/Thr protein kinase)
VRKAVFVVRGSCSEKNGRDEGVFTNTNHEHEPRTTALSGALMSLLERRFTIKANDFVKAGEVSLEIQGLLKKIGFEPAVVRRVSICAYEAEMNVVMHGGDGEMLLRVEPEKIHLSCRDEGGGIEDIELAFQPGYSTATPEHQEMGFGAGMGLPNIKKNASSLDVDSRKGGGTRLTMVFEVKDGHG